MPRRMMRWRRATRVYLRVEDSARVRNHRREKGRFVYSECRGGFVKVMLRRRLRAINSVAPLDHVQIDLQNAALRQQPLEHDCHQSFLTLANERSLRGEVKILRQLL